MEKSKFVGFVCLVEVFVGSIRQGDIGELGIIAITFFSCEGMALKDTLG